VNGTTPTPKIPGGAQLEHAERLSPGGDLWAHKQNLKGLQNLQRDIQGFEMIFARVMDGGAKFLPGFYSQFNAVSRSRSCWPPRPLRRRWRCRSMRRRRLSSLGRLPSRPQKKRMVNHSSLFAVST
jgi:hypothetical protein